MRFLRNPRIRALLTGSLAASALATVGGAQVNYSSPVVTPVGNAPAAIKAVDADQDGDKDLFVANSADNNVSVMVNDGAGNFTLAGNVPVGLGPVSIEVLDLDGDGFLDIVTTNLGSNDLTVARGNGMGYNAPLSYPCGLSPFSQTISDFDGDGDLDVLVANFNSNNLTLVSNLGLGNFAAGNGPFLGANPSAIVHADLDRDGDKDLAISFAGFNNVGIYEAIGGTYVPRGAVATGFVPFDMKAVDVNFDGYLDLVTANILSNSVSILSGSAGLNFLPAVSKPVAARPIRIVTTQADARLGVDLVALCFDGFSTSLLLNNTGSTFQAAQTTLVAISPAAVVSADLNGDYFDDLAVVSFRDDQISLLLNQAPAVPYPGTGEDLVLATGVSSGTPIVSGGAGNYIKEASAGQNVVIAIDSPNGSFDNLATFIGLQIMLPGFPPIPGTPGLWLNNFGFGASMALISPALQPSGETIGGTLPTPLGSLLNFTMIVQGFVPTPLAANAILATTDAYEFRFVP